MYQPSGGQPTEYRGGGWIFQLEEEHNRKLGRPTLAKRPKLLEKLPLEKVDEINRAFLKLNPLKAEHRATLLQAGVPNEDIGSLEHYRAEEMAQALVVQFGEETALLHPLLRLLPSKAGIAHSWTIAGALGDGLLFPAFSVEGLILGIQLRLDNPPSGEERYRWLSSEGKGGTPLTVFPARARERAGFHPDPCLGPGVVSHSEVANSNSLKVATYRQGNESEGNDLTPASTSTGLVSSRYRRETLLITEGYKKAAVINRQWGSPTISLAGVSAYHREELVRTIQKLEAGRIALAFDQDKRHKLPVQLAETRLIRVLREALPEVKLYQLEWDGCRGKGVDDALLARATFYLTVIEPNVNDQI